MEEAQKIDKRSKAYKQSLSHTSTLDTVTEPFTGNIYPKTDIYEPKQMDKTQIDKLIESGIPVSEAQFQSAVNNADKVPENMFSEVSDNKNRRVKMWLVCGGTFLLCYQKNTLNQDRYFGVHCSNIKFWNFK